MLIGLGIYAIAAAANLRNSIEVLWFNSDTAFVPVVAELSKRYGLRGGLAANLHNSFTTLLFDLATRGLPFRFGLWQATPLTFTVIGVLLTAFMMRRFAPAWAIAATCVLLLCPRFSTLAVTGTQAVHVDAVFFTMVLGALLVALVNRPPKSRLVFAAAIPIGLVLGASVASDLTLLPLGFGPFVGVAAYRAWRMRVGADAAFRWVALVTVIAAIATVATFAVMSAGHVRFVGGAVSSPSHPRTAVLRTWWSLRSVWPALVAPIVLGWVWHKQKPSPGANTITARRDSFVAFWITSMSSVILAFVLTGADTSAVSRYVFVPVTIATGVVAPIVFAQSRWARRVLSVGIAVVVVGAAHTLPSPPTAAVRMLVLPPLTSQLKTALLAAHATVGYSGYWTATSVTFRAHGAIEVAPVRTCNATLCQFELNTLDDWYRARPNIRSFVLVDPYAPKPRLRVSAPAAFGTPAQELRVGQLRIYVYDYDVATRFGPPAR